MNLSKWNKLKRHAHPAAAQSKRRYSASNSAAAAKRWQRSDFRPSGILVSGNRRVAGRYLRAELWLLTICHWPAAFLRSTDVATPLRFTGAGTALSFGPFFRPMV